MPVQTRKPNAPKVGAAFRHDEALLEAAQQVFCARRMAQEAAQRADANRATVRAHRAEAARRTRQWHRALRDNLQHSRLAQRLEQRRLNGTERDALVALVLSQLGLLPARMPLADDVDLGQLSQCDLTGGEIKNVVLNAARLTLQRSESARVTMADFRKAIQMEQEGKWQREGRTRIGF